jgi:hypothetical protein
MVPLTRGYVIDACGWSWVVEKVAKLIFLGVKAKVEVILLAKMSKKYWKLDSPPPLRRRLCLRQNCFVFFFGYLCKFETEFEKFLCVP